MFSNRKGMTAFAVFAIVAVFGIIVMFSDSTGVTGWAAKPKVPILCTDSDASSGNNDVFVPGTTALSQGVKPKGAPKVDACKDGKVGTAKKSGKFAKLTEYSCSAPDEKGNQKIVKRSIECPNEFCIGSACHQPGTPAQHPDNARCSADNECASGICLTVTANGNRRCSQPQGSNSNSRCSRNEECASNICSAQNVCVDLVGVGGGSGSNTCTPQIACTNGNTELTITTATCNVNHHLCAVQGGSCQNNVCVGGNTGCSDTATSSSPYAAGGNVSFGIGGQREDACDGPNTLRKYSCFNNYVVETRFSCNCLSATKNCALGPVTPI